MSRQIWMKIHVYLSLFFLPAAFIYALTGALYLFGIRENFGANIHDFQIDSVTKGKEKELILDILEKNGLKIPSDTELRNFRGNLSMGSIKYNATLIFDNKTNSYTLKVVDRSIYGILLLMHKGKGAFWFDIIAVGFAISLMLFYFSGLVMTAFCKNKRGVAFGVFLLGLLITSIMIFLSI